MSCGDGRMGSEIILLIPRIYKTKRNRETYTPMKYKYETHLHTFPASKCGKATVFESLKFYKEAGYDGVFLTNHFIGGNIGCDHDLPIAEQLEFFFEDYYQSQVIGKELGLKVYPGVELSYQGTDFLIYGLEPEFYFSHPEFFDLDFTEKLSFLCKAGAFIVQAHPFREESWIPCIRLAPRFVHAVETINACNKDHENHMANIYADEYELPKTAGSDNHRAGGLSRYAGIQLERPLKDGHDYMRAVLNNEIEIFTWDK